VGRMRVAGTAWLALALYLCTASTAFAHPKIAEARTRVEAAEFDAALRLLAEAEAGTDLGREDALSLLELRALVYLALRDAGHAQETLRMLAALAPGRVFAPGTSPDLVHAFARVKEDAPPPPHVSLEPTLAADGVHLRGHVEGDPLHLVRALRLWTRVGDAPFRSTLADETILLAPPGQRVEYRAVAEGIGGAPVAATRIETLQLPQERAAETHTSPWLYAGLVTGALAIAGTVVIAIALSGGSSDQTQPSAPQVVGK
jgi:hypothetical protein